MRNLENCIIRLLKKRPFYGHFILNLRRIQSNSKQTAGVTLEAGIPTLMLNPELFGSLENRQQEALLEHLVKHLVHLHPVRRKQRNHNDWNICTDIAINPSIEELPDTALLPELFNLDQGLAAEEYYDLLSNRFRTGNLEGNGYGDGDEEDTGAAGEGKCLSRGNFETLDDHQCWSKADSTPQKLAEEMVKTITKNAIRGSDGQLPTDISAAITAILKPSPIPWRQILQQFIATAGRVGKHSTWKREHRRFSHITPGIEKKHRLNLLLGIDVSDSTNIVAIREAFAQELLHIARGREAHITVVYANSRIQKIEQFNSASPIITRHHGGGFTDLRPLFDYARTMQPPPAAIIYLTDGMGPVPEQMEFPTLWVLTADGEKPAPWGVELRLSQL